MLVFALQAANVLTIDVFNKSSVLLTNIAWKYAKCDFMYMVSFRYLVVITKYRLLTVWCKLKAIISGIKILFNYSVTFFFNNLLITVFTHSGFYPLIPKDD